MTTMKKMLCMVLTFALLLTFGCKKDDKTETQDVPETPDNTVEASPMEQPPVEDPTPAEPVINTWPALTPDKVIPEKDVDTLDLDAREAAFNSYREVGYFIEWQLGSEYRVIETIPGEKDGEYLLWGMRIKEPGIREPFQMQVKVTPDGKDFSLLSKKILDVTEEWKAVQNYRWLVTNCSQGPDQLFEALGFEAITVDNVADIPYEEFEAAMLTIMTQEMYDTHWADLLWEQDGKLGYTNFGGSGDHYIVEMVQPQEDGSYLSYEFIHDGFDTFSTFFVQVDLEAQPNGTFRVAAWDADNAALMEQSYTAMPIGLTGDLSTPFPVPTGEKMGLTGEDAVLYTALAKEVTPAPDTLTLLSINLLGSYPGEDGETHYVCSIHESHFHDASISATEATYSSMGSRGYLSRVTIALDGLLEYTYSTEDGADNTQREQEIFGPLTEAHAAWKKGTAIPNARQLLPTGDALLKLYQQAYFPQN